MVLGRSPYQWQHEPVLYGWLPNGNHKWFSDRKQTTVWNFDRPTQSRLHPTMKPIPLLAYPIKNSTAPNAVVLGYLWRLRQHAHRLRGNRPDLLHHGA